MPNYANSKIYKLVSKHTDQVYFGSTTQSLALRKGQHVNQYKCWKNGKHHYTTSFELLKLGDVDIILVEKIQCDSKEELHARERYHIETNECFNKVIPNRTKQQYDEQYYQKNKDKIKTQTKKYRESNKEKWIQYNRQYYEEKKDMLSKKMKAYYENNKDRIVKMMTAKVQCECGCVISKCNLNKHRKTKKHKKYLESIKD